MYTLLRSTILAVNSRSPFFELNASDLPLQHFNIVGAGRAKHLLQQTIQRGETNVTDEASP